MKKTAKKALYVLLTVVLTFGYAGLLSGVVGNDLFGTKLTAHADTWSGTISDPGGSEYVTSGNTVHLKSARALVWFINRIANGNSFENMTVYLDVDVDLGSHDFGNTVFPYNSGRLFKGTFDGQNHTISNFKMTHSDHRVAMFRQTSNATFRNLNFNSVFIDDSSDSNKKNGFAVLVGYHDSGNLTFENVHVNSGNIYGYNYVGALVGEVGANSSGNRVNITNCSNGATISGNNVRIGGLVGSSLPAVYATNCTNTGNVTGGSTDIGGIVGWIEDDPSTFSGCSNSGAIQGSDSVGGILGYFGNNSQDQKLTLKNNTNTGNITSNNRAAGICALIDTDNNAHEISGNTNRGTINAGSDGGGIVARNKGFGVWTNNRNYGSVSGGNDNAGGICGEVEDDKQVFSNCYNSGAITGQNTTGGIAGWLDTAHENTFTRCANSGNITSKGGYAAGIQGGGKKESTFTECYNVGTISGQGDSGGLAGHVEYHTFWNRCFNAGNVTAPSNKSTGGLIGYTSYYGNDTNKRMVDDCFNWGTITAGTAGGLVGYVNDGKPYKVEYSYNTGTVNGSQNAWAFVGYGGNCGNQCFKTWNTGSGTYKTSQEMIDYNFSIDGYFCKNTWGVKVNGTTYYYPILTWYRNLFLFNSSFVDGTSNTNTTISKLYGNSFTAPTISGATGIWANDANWNATFAQGASVNPGVTAPTHQYVVTQETSNVESIHNDTTYHLHRTMTLNVEENPYIRTNGDRMYYRFTPSESGDYIFFSYKGSYVDSIIEVYNLGNSGSYISRNDDYPDSTIYTMLGAERRQSYTGAVSLTAGTTYVVKAYCYSSNTGTYPMKVCKAVNVTFDATGGATTFTKVLPAGHHGIKMNQTGLTRSGHTLIAWSTSGVGQEDKHCMAEQTITIPSSETTYYALWYPNSPTELAVNSSNTTTITAPAEIPYFTFTPTETRTYLLYSNSTATALDPFVLIYDDSAYRTQGTYLSFDDDEGNNHHDFVGDSNRNFYKEIELTAGTKYLFGVKAYHNTTANNNQTTGSYPFHFEAVYKVEYDANGGSGAPAAQKKYYNRTLTLSSDRPTREGYTFLGWSTVQNAAAAAFYPGGSYASNADMVLYAVWQINESDLKILPNGGTWNNSTDPQTFTRNYGTVFSVGTPTPPAQFFFTGWALNDDANGSFNSATNEYTFGPAAYTTDVLTANYVQVVKNDTYVLDFGLGTKLDVLENDNLVSGVALKSVAAGAGYTASVITEGGVKKIGFTPSAAMTGVISFTYTATYQSKDFTATVTVIPANNVYYEDDFFDFSDTSGTAWSNAGTLKSDAVQQAVEAAKDDSADLYGADAAYDTSDTYSLGRAKYVTVTKDAKTAAKASFTFTGTGFDLYALTDSTTGFALVDIYRVENGAETKVKGMMVNTYYGYEYGQLYLNGDTVTLDSSYPPIYYTPEGETGSGTFFINGTRRGWLMPTYYSGADNTVAVGESADHPAYAYGWVAKSVGEGGGVYQAPVISELGLAHGTYRVTVQPRYSAMQDTAHQGSYTFYIDSVRVYNPLDPEALPKEAQPVYNADNENSARFVDLRDQLLKKETAVAVAEGGDPDAWIDGIVFLENKGVSHTTIEDYTDIGPKNEIYLARNQSIAFNLNTTAQVQPAKLAIGVKLVKGSAGSVQVSSASAVSFNLTGKTDQFRDITGAVQWANTTGGYQTTAPVVITNTSSEGVIISLTKLKWSFGQFVPQPQRTMQFRFAAKNLSFVGSVMDEINAEQTTASSEGVTVTWDQESLEIGGTATLTITAPASFEKAFKDGSEIAGFTELPDGSRQWTVTVTVEEPGEYTCDVTLEDADGYTTKAISAGSFTVIPPAEPEPDPDDGTADDGNGTTDGDNSNTGRRSFYDLLQAILNFFRKIVAFFQGQIR